MAGGGVETPWMRLFWIAALALAACQLGASPVPVPVGIASDAPRASSAPASSPPASSPPASAASGTAAPPFTSSERFDLLIAGGRVTDGTGAAAVIADVLIDDGAIVHVGRVDAAVVVQRRLDASGMVVAPGFIDAHAHGDARDSHANFLAMGVTTLCIGQDGKSPSDVSFSSWAAGLAGERLAANVAPLVGHASVRVSSNVGMAPAPSDAEVERMAHLVEQAMAAGAWGLSTGLEYEPGSAASERELVALAKPVALRGGIVMSHLRSEDDDKIDAALDELIAQGKGSGARVHVAHIKVVHGKGEARAERLLEKLDRARRSGVRLSADIYPYEASYTGIGIVFPDFAKPPHSYAEAKATRRAELEARLRERVIKRGGPSATLFGSPDELRGKTLAEVAKERGKDWADVLIDIGPNGAGAAYFVMDEALQARLLVDAQIMIGTDGSGGSQHPRGYGAFAKVIRRFVVEEKRLSIEEAVRKMSGLPAETIGLTRARRGLLRAGWAADVVVFDPAGVRDRSSYVDPQRLATGMRWVLVNGVVALDDGKLTGRRGGRLLLKSGGLDKSLLWAPKK